MRDLPPQNPWERLTEEDVNNIKYSGDGCVSFLLTVLSSVLVTFMALDLFGLLEIWK